MLHKFFDLISALLAQVVSLLPSSPFTGMIESFAANSEVQTMLGYMNYFLPIPAMLSALGVWLVAIAAYYIIAPLLRWSKAVQS